ncbi:MAG: hypothetical protein WC718_00060 [Phycisphaerales bacterium]|jgi:hypothetical protein
MNSTLTLIHDAIAMWRRHAPSGELPARVLLGREQWESFERWAKAEVDAGRTRLDDKDHLAGPPVGFGDDTFWFSGVRVGRLPNTLRGVMVEGNVP